MCCHDGVMAPIQDARTYARLFLGTCQAALKLQYHRVLELAEGPRDTAEWRLIEPDCYLLVLAIKQAILSLQAVAYFEDEPIKSEIGQVIGIMDTEFGGLQDLTDLRDMLTHFDKYLKGDGWLQPGGRLRSRRPHILDEFDMHRKWRYDPHGDKVLLWVRAMGISVEVLGMSRAVLILMAELQETLHSF
jgi:hypothetical protein